MKMEQGAARLDRAPESREYASCIAGGQYRIERTMSVREFKDSEGRDWRAWDVAPDELNARIKNEDFLASLNYTGWIAFEPGTRARSGASLRSQRDGARCLTRSSRRCSSAPNACRTASFPASPAMAGSTAEPVRAVRNR